MTDKKFDRLAYGRYGVLTRQGQPPVGIAAVYATDDFKHLQFDGNIDGEETFSVSKLNIFPRSGTMYFRSKGLDHRVRELRDEDGIWLSKYRISLPEDALGALIKLGGQVDLNEQLVAVATEVSPYVVGLTYSNATGRYARQDGDWILTADNDTTFDSMIPLAIDPDRAEEFVKLYDDNFVSVSDAQAFEVPGDDADAEV